MPTFKRTIGYTDNLDLADRLLNELQHEIDWSTNEELDDNDVLCCASQLAEVANELLHQVVTLYRENHHTWADVAEILDVSRQAAQQRFGA